MKIQEEYTVTCGVAAGAEGGTRAYIKFGVSVLQPDKRKRTMVANMK